MTAARRPSARGGASFRAFGGVALVLVALLALALAWPVRAGAAPTSASSPAPAAPPVLDLAAVARHADLTPNLQILVDEAGQLQRSDALAAPGWVPATPARLAPGVRPGAYWLRASMTNRSAAPVTRWMVIGSPRIEQIDLYQITADGVPVVAQMGGLARALREHPLPGMASAFPIEVAPGQQLLVLVRVTSRTILQMSFSLWEPLAWLDESASDDLGVLLPVAALFTLAISLTMVGSPGRDAVTLLLAAWLTGVGFHELAFNGFIYRYLLPEGGEWAVRMPALTVVFSRALLVFFVHRFLEMDKLPGWRWVLPSIGGVLLLTLPYVLWGDLRVAIKGLNLFAATYAGAGLACVAIAVRRRHRHGLMALIGCLALLGVNAMRLLQLTGTITDADRLFEPSLIYMLGVSVVLMANVIRNSLNDRRRAVANREALLLSKEADRRRLETAVDQRTQALALALVEARDANRAKREFLASVSQDLRSPLTNIIDQAETVLAAGGRDAESARIIRRSAQHLLALLDDLIDYSRGARQLVLVQEPVYTTVVLDAVAAEGRALAGRNGNAFDFRVGPGLPLVIEADIKRLRQVLGNLLSNAAKFTRDGQIELTVEVEPGAPLRPGAPAPFVFTVRDTGPGIPPPALHDIFRPFVRLPSSGRTEGLGLGLSIARQWIQRMGGDIVPSSVPGSGTTMQVKVPLTVSSEAALPSSAQVEDERAESHFGGQGLPVWVVEDFDVIRDLLVGELQADGFEALGFADGAALAAHAAAAERPALVITDLKMPNADGQAVLAEVRRRWPGLPVVLLTSTPSAQVLAMQHPGGFSAIVQKPVSLPLMRQTVGRLLGLRTDGVSVSQPLGALLPAPPRAGGVRALGPQLRAQLQALVRECAISDIGDWADRLAVQEPHSREFALQVKALADRTDLKSLRALFDQEHWQDSHL